MKAGAWTPCPACGFKPAGPEELAKAVLVSDNCLAQDVLEQFAARRQQGEPWNFDPEMVEMVKGRLVALIPLDSNGRPKGT